MTDTEGRDECADVMHDVWLFLDDELDPDRRAAVQRHLDECSPCLEEAGIDTKLKALLARRCGGDHAPDELRERIVGRLLERRSTVATTVHSADGAITGSVRRTSVTVQWERDGE